MSAPGLTCKYPKPCGGCGEVVPIGTPIHWDGAEKVIYHVACAPAAVKGEVPVPEGTNKWPGRCVACNAKLAPGQGALSQAPTGKWQVKCATGKGCQATPSGHVETLIDTLGAFTAAVKAKPAKAQKAPPAAPKKQPAAAPSENGASPAAAFTALAKAIDERPDLCGLAREAAATAPAVSLGRRVAVRPTRRGEYLGILCDADLMDGEIVNLHALVEFGGVRMTVPIADLDLWSEKGDTP